MLPESKRRLAIATSAFDAGRVFLYQNKTITLEARKVVFEAAVKATIFNVANWKPEGRAWEAIEGGYSRILRRLLQPHFPSQDFLKIPVPLVHMLTRSPPLAIHARQARLSLLCSLASSGPAGLWAMLQHEGDDWLRLLQSDLTKGREQDWPAVNEASWPRWRMILTESAAWFKKRVKKRCQADFHAYCVENVDHLRLWSLYRRLCQRLPGCEPKPQEWCCRPCSKSFGSKAQLAVHMFKTHKRRAAYRLCAKGTKCEACGREYWEENRRAIHLRKSERCQRTLHSCIMATGSLCLARALAAGRGGSESRSSSPSPCPSKSMRDWNPSRRRRGESMRPEPTRPYATP